MGRRGTDGFSEDVVRRLLRHASGDEDETHVTLERIQPVVDVAGMLQPTRQAAMGTQKSCANLGYGVSRSVSEEAAHHAAQVGD